MCPYENATLAALIEREFPIRKHSPARGRELGRDGGVYANHAALAPWPRSVADAVRAFADENTAEGPAHYRDWIERERRLRAQLAELIRAPAPADIALLKNTTEAISVVAFGLDWKDGDRIVLPKGEFPSNRLPWLAQQSRGVTVREVDIRAADDAEQALVDAMDDRTRLLTVSAVQWNDGFRLDLERLGAACRDRDVLFFVDAIQQLGALQLDVAACHADFLAADAHKWLLGPEGIAVFFSTARARPQLRLLQQGWHMFDNPWAFHRTDWTPADSARRFEAGSPNSLGQAAFAAALDLLLGAGIETIERRVLANTEGLIEGLAGMRGIELVSATGPRRRSGIVTFRPADGSAPQAWRELRERGIECALRDQAIRLSPHFYQGAAEVQTILESVEAVL